MPATRPRLTNARAIAQHCRRDAPPRRAESDPDRHFLRSLRYAVTDDAADAERDEFQRDCGKPAEQPAQKTIRLQGAIDQVLELDWRSHGLITIDAPDRLADRRNHGERLGSAHDQIVRLPARACV
jgi:hypothetical protein